MEPGLAAGGTLTHTAQSHSGDVIVGRVKHIGVVVGVLCHAVDLTHHQPNALEELDSVGGQRSGSAVQTMSATVKT